MTSVFISTGRAIFKQTYSNFQSLLNVAKPIWNGYSGSEKSTHLTNYSDAGWAVASASEKADALRAIVTLLIVAVGWLIVREVNGQQ